MAIDLVTNRHKKIQNMSLDDMANYLGEILDLCCYTGRGKCPVCRTCTQCWKEFLQGDDN